MSAMASVTYSVSFPSSLQKPHMALNEIGGMLQAWAPQMRSRRLALAAEHLCVRLVTMLLLGINLIPSISCDRRSAHYSSHEIVIPKSLTANGTKDPGQASYMLFMQGQKQLVHLKLKRGYFVNNFPVYSYHHGALQQEMPFISHDCHYEGYIEGVPGSFVSVNTCSGLRGVLMKEETSYGIEPVLSSERFEHVLYTMAHQGPVSCSVASKHSQGDTSQRQKNRKPQHVQAASSLWSHTKYVEMFVVVNNQRFQMWGSNISETVRAVVDIIALANSFTRGINTEVVLVGMEIWSEGDLIEVPVDLQVVLRNFNRWRQEKLHHHVRHDVAHLVVGHHPGESTGQAFLSGACSSGFAAAVESFHHEDVLLFAALMVHELGHNLGIQHDHAACACEDKRFCLMRENITKHSGFSNCSSDDYYRFLHEHKGACLFNRPEGQSRQLRSARCGNGVVEPPEQCDCGDACESNQCCDNNCRLKGDAQCSNEPCCTRCKFHSKGHTCRHSENPCDLPEFCDGVSAACPENRVVQDGSTCHKSYYCLNGMCMDPSSQCSMIYGFGAKSASKECYSSLNSKGNRFGNCGVPSQPQGNYVPCSDDNVLCGKLICTAVSFIPPIKDKHTLLQVPYGEDWCWSMDAFDQKDIPDQGNVQNGIICASGKACTNFQCVDSSIAPSSCTAETTCNGNGVCNDLKHCHCNPGFAPPDCVKEGNGGSVDSGPPGKPSDYNTAQSTESPSSFEDEEWELELKLYIIAAVLVILALLVIICGFKAYQRSKEAAAEPPPGTTAPPAEPKPAAAPKPAKPPAPSTSEVLSEAEQSEEEEEEESD